MEKTKEEENIFRDFLKKEKGMALTSIETYISYFKAMPDSLDQQNIKSFVISKKNCFAVRGFTKALLEFTGLTKQIDMPPKSVGRKKQRLIRSITHDEIKRIKEFLYKKNFQHGLFFDLMVEGALRISEVSPIQLNSFDWFEWLKDSTKKGKLHIIGKGNKERIVLVNSETMQLILDHLVDKNPNMDIDFMTNDKTLLFNELYKRKIYRIITKASMDVIKRSIRPHELRHHRSSDLLKKGNDIRDIKNYLGHSSIATTEIYLHTDSNESLNNIEKKEK